MNVVSTSPKRNPSPLTGLLWGVIFMLPVIIVMSLGYTLAGFTILPLRLFDWMARFLPAEVVNFGREIIGGAAGQFRVVEGSTSATAKVAEQIMGYGVLFVIAAIAGGLFFFLMNRIRASGTYNRRDIIPGVVLSLLVAIPLILMDNAVGQTGGSSGFPTIIWNLGLLLLWGAAVNYLYNGLAYRAAALVSEAALAAKGEPTASVHAIDRRQFLIQIGGATAAVTVVGAGLSALLNQTTPSSATVLSPAAEATLSPELAALPNAADPIAIVAGTRPEITPLAQHYRIDISTLPPVIQEEGYTLPFTTQLDGAQTTLAEMTLDDIRAMDSVDAYITMSCISNPVGGDLISTIKWTGVPMQAVLAAVGVPEGATHLKITGADGFDEFVALDIINADERVMLAYAWDNQPLLSKHGFPLRIHIPDLYGMKQPKWINGIEFTAADEDGYWVRRGWDKEARVLAVSVVDTVAINDIFERDGQMFVPIGGIAWAGTRGISNVQISVDGGEWAEAEVRTAINDRTWQLWRYEWPFTEGNHRFEVRCIEASGAPQIEAQARTFPAGASGYQSVQADIRAPIMRTSTPAAGA